MEQNKAEKKLNIAIVQAFDKNIREYAEYSRLINALYAYQKGYTYISFEDDLVPVHVSVYYNKILAIQRVFQDSRNFDWVFYLDSDAAVSNFKYNIEDLIMKHSNREFIMTCAENVYSSGVIVIKNTPSMQGLLEEAYTTKQFFHTRTPEESALLWCLYDHKYAGKAYFEDASFLNASFEASWKLFGKPAMAFWTEDSFILHLWALSTEDRVNALKNLLTKLNILCIANPEKPSRLEVELPQVGPDPQKGQV
jgi:hypothetical protein